MAGKRIKTTRLDIIKCASEFFFEKGYSVTFPKHICDRLDLYTGNITYYFPTKEHLLAVFVEMLCNFQWKMLEEEVQDGFSSVLAVCLELATMAAICEEDEVAKDFYISAYTSPMCLEIIRRNDTRRAKQVFGDYRPEWTDERFAEAEILVSGVEYATLMTAGDNVSLELRIEGALENILTTFGIPEEIRKTKIAKVLGMDYRNISRRVLDEFKKFIAQTNEKALEDLIEAKKRN